MKRAALVEFDANVPSPPAKRAKKSVLTDRLIVFNLSTTLLTSTVLQWLRGNGTSSSNASLPGVVRPAPVSRLKFITPDVDRFGPCWTYSNRERRNGVTRESLKLVEGGSNSDSPRSALGVIWSVCFS